MDLLSPSTKISILSQKCLKTQFLRVILYEVSIVYWLACWPVDLMIVGSNPTANFFNFSFGIEILVEGDRRSIRFMGKKMADFVQLRSATL